MSDLDPLTQPLASDATEEFSALKDVLSDVRRACAALPKDEQRRYEEAQQSVVDARRNAETHEGLLQIC